MADRDIRINVTVDSDTRGSREAATSLKEVDESADKAGKSMSGMAEQSRKLDAELAETKSRVKDLRLEFANNTSDTGVFGDLRKEEANLRRLERVQKGIASDIAEASKGAEKSAEKIGDQFTSMAPRIAAVHERVKALRLEFAKTGNTSIFGDLRREESRLHELERVAKDIAADVAAAGKGIFGNILEGASGGGGPAKMAFIGGLVALAATAAPAIGAMVGGAVAGTVAGGGVIGGIIAASADSRVQAAWHNLAGEFTAEAFGGGAFVQPTIDAIDEIRVAVQGVDLKSMFAQAAPAVDELADGVAGFITNLKPGLSEAFSDSEKYSRVFGEGLSDTGAALSDFLHSILSSPGTIEGLSHGLSLLNATIVGVGNVLEGLGDVFDWTVHRGAEFSGQMEDIVGKVPVLGAAFRWMNDLFEHTEQAGKGASNGGGAFADAIKRMVEPTVDEAEQLAKLNEQLAAFNLAGLAADATADALVASYMDLADSVAENGTSLDQWDQQGNRNRVTIRGLLQDLENQRQANIKAGMSTQDANAQYAEQANVLQNRLTVELGFAADAVAGLIGQYKNIPTVVTTEFRQLYTSSTGGYAGGEHSGLGDVRDRFQAFDTGGMVKGPPGSAQMVIAHAGEMVLTPAQQAARWSGADNYVGSSGSGGGVSATPLVLSGSGLDALVFEWLRTQIANRGGTLAVLGLREN